VKIFCNGFQASADSTCFKPNATYSFSVFYDFNHESNKTPTYIDKVLEFWLTENKMDGYRFDLSKGFTQIKSDPNVGLWGQYDASRIKILKRF